MAFPQHNILVSYMTPLRHLADHLGTWCHPDPAAEPYGRLLHEVLQDASGLSMNLLQELDTLTHGVHPEWPNTSNCQEATSVLLEGAAALLIAMVSTLQESIAVLLQRGDKSDITVVTQIQDALLAEDSASCLLKRVRVLQRLTCDQATNK
jgi:hypothetical protein